eukprot:9121013-Prorocentrum_lima.AAC.1
MTSSLVGSEMCIRDRYFFLEGVQGVATFSCCTLDHLAQMVLMMAKSPVCLLYTSDAADDM